MTDDEKKGWIAAAAAVDGGRGLVLVECNPDNDDDMQYVFEALNVTDFPAKTRLRSVIRGLQEPKVAPSEGEFGIVVSLCCFVDVTCCVSFGNVCFGLRGRIFVLFVLQ